MGQKDLFLTLSRQEVHWRTASAGLWLAVSGVAIHADKARAAIDPTVPAYSCEKYVPGSPRPFVSADVMCGVAHELVPAAT